MSQSNATPGQVVGFNLKTVRAQQGITQEQLVERVRRLGLEWTRAQVASLESGRRQDLTFTELALLSAAFDVPLARWFQGPPFMVALGAASASSGALENLAAGKKLTDPVSLQWDVEPVALEAEVHAASRLGVDPDRVRASAQALWGRSLLAEREDHVQADVSNQSQAARRGHVTRALIKELRKHIEEEPS